jgi:hypothetical protein
LKANFISADDLIAAKLASGRPRDLADVDDIRKAREAQKKAGKKNSPRNKPKSPNRCGQVDWETSTSQQTVTTPSTSISRRINTEPVNPLPTTYHQNRRGDVYPFVNRPDTRRK